MNVSKTKAYRLIPAVLFLALAGYYISLVRDAGPTTFDDAYMFIRYADNFLRGHGIAWNPDGIQTYGTTSILYLGLVIVGRAVFQGVSSGALLTVLSSGLGLAAVVAIAFTCSRYAKSASLKGSFLWLTVIFTALFVTSPVFLFHIKSGMDTTLSLLCNTLLICSSLGWVYNERGRHNVFLALTVLTSYLAFLARPDNLIYSILFPALILLHAGEDKKGRLIYFLGWLFALLAVDTAVKFIVFHDPLPLPFYAKSSGYYEGYVGVRTWNPIEYLFGFGSLALPFLVVMSFSLTKNTARLFAAFTIPAALTFAYYFTVVQIMGFEARFYFPSLPYLAIGSFVMLDRSLDSKPDAGTESPKIRMIRTAAILLAVSLLSNSTLKTIASDAYRNTEIASTRLYLPKTEFTTPAGKPLPERGTRPMVLAVAKFAKTLPEGTVFAQSEYGFVGAEASHIQIIDLVGLHDPYFAHNGFSVDELLRRKPDLIWFPHADYTKITAEIIDSREFWEQYDFYPGAFDFGLAIRRDSPKHQVMNDVIGKAWREVYETRRMKDYLATPTTK